MDQSRARVAIAKAKAMVADTSSTDDAADWIERAALDAEPPVLRRAMHYTVHENAPAADAYPSREELVAGVGEALASERERARNYYHDMTELVLIQYDAKLDLIRREMSQSADVKALKGEVTALKAEVKRLTDALGRVVNELDIVRATAEGRVQRLHGAGG